MDILKPRRSRRKHSEEFKAEMVRACSDPGVSISGVALANGVNRNLVRRWMKERGVFPASLGVTKPVVVPSSEPASFMPVMISGTSSGDIRIEIRRGGTVVKADWPVSAAGDCAAWLRDWLK